jgi:chaperonin GroES
MEAKTNEDHVKEVESIIKLNLGTFYDRVIVVPDPTEQKTKSGIIIPDTAQEKPRKGTVAYVGPDCHGTDDYESKPNTLQVKPLDRVIYGKYAGAEMKINGVHIVVMRESDIFFNYDKSNEVRIELL